MPDDVWSGSEALALDLTVSFQFDTQKENSELENKMD